MKKLGVDCTVCLNMKKEFLRSYVSFEGLDETKQNCSRVQNDFFGTVYDSGNMRNLIDCNENAEDLTRSNI